MTAKMRPIDRALGWAKALGMNQSALSAAMGVTPQDITNWKKRGMPPEHYAAAAEAVKRTVDELLGRQRTAAVVDVQELPRWPFAHELYLRFQRLDDDGKREVESDIRHRIDRIEEARRSPRKSTAQACGGG